MSNIEHLIENAICAIKENKNYDYWLSQWQQQAMLKDVKSPAEEIWEMALYCYYTYREGIIWETTDELEEKYGYKVPD